MKNNELTPNPTFHHLYVPYNEDNSLTPKRVNEYENAPQMRDQLLPQINPDNNK